MRLDDAGDEGPMSRAEPDWWSDDVEDDLRDLDADELETPEDLDARLDDASVEDPPSHPGVESLPTGEDRSAVTPQVIPTPEGQGSIEGMGESFSPQLNTGGAGFSVPIALPPGRGGTQPGLSLGYGSGGGNGILGIGWDVAVPFIARQVDQGMPTYRAPLAGFANDRFKYNGGQELIQVSPADGETFQLSNINTCTLGGGRCGPNDWLYFRARVEGAFLRFFMRGDGLQWRVQDKSGTWFYFGAVQTDDVPADQTVASLVTFRVQDGTSGGRDVVYRWNLTRVVDASGNDVWYTYERDRNQSYLRHVYWNSPASAARTLGNYQHHAELVYDRTGRSDVVTGYASGFPITTAWRLHRVIVESVPFNASPGSRQHTRTYLFTYDPSNWWSLLTGVQMFGKGCLDGSRDRVIGVPSGCTVDSGLALPPLALGYTQVSRGVSTDGFGYLSDAVETFAASPDRSIDDDRTDLFDANRDGLPDLLITDPARCSGGHCLWINQTGATGRVEMRRTTSNISLPSSIGADFTMSNTNVNPLEMDGDGAVEWLHMPHRRSYRYFRLEHDDTLPLDTRHWLDGYRWQEYGPFEPGTVDADIDFTRDADDIRLVDLNNDHLVDLVRTTGTQMQHWLNLSRCGPEFVGRFGTPIIDAYGRCVDAETDAGGADKPIATCVLHRGMPMQFSNGDLRLADMNGDGLQDIVHLRSGSIAYWPGRGYVAGQTQPVFWGVSSDRSACRAGTYGTDLELTMTNSPRILTIEDDARIMLLDANGDGLTDLVQVRFNAVDVWLNRGGTAFSDRVILSGVPHHPGIVNRVRAADVNGSTSTDLVWGTGGDYRFLDFTAGIQPRLLTRVENGMGKTSDVTYRSSTSYAAEARDVERRPWRSFSPFPMQVVSGSTVTDNLGGVYRTEYKYRDAFYDGWEAEFRGFGEAEVKTVGDANSPTSVSITRFEPGLMPAWACAGLPGAATYAPNHLLNPRCMFEENPLEAMKGAVTSTETCDESRTVCQGAATTRYAVRRLYPAGTADRSVWYAYAAESHAWVYDTSVLPTGTTPNTLGGYDIHDGPDESSDLLGTGTWSLDVKTFAAGGSYRLESSVSDIDFWGNVGTSTNVGAVDISGDEVVSHAVYDAGLIDDRYIHAVNESWTDDGATRLGHTFVAYDSPSPCSHLPSTVSVSGSDPDHWNGPETLSYVRSNVLYDGAFCQPSRTCAGDACSGTPMGQAWVTYDAQYAAFPVTETIDTSHPGHTSSTPDSTLTTSASWYAEYGTVRSATDPSGLVTSVVLDNLGRPVRMYRPGCDEPAAEISYHLRSRLSYVRTRTNEECDGDMTAIAGEAMEAYAYVDGMGRARAAVSEGDPLDGFGWILSGIQTFDAKGAVQRAYLPVARASALLADGAPPTVTSLYARSAYDAFGRVLRAWTTDGTDVVATRYGALSTEVWDAGDLAPGQYHRTPATTFTDGLGRTVLTVERNRSAGSSGLEIFGTRLVYNPLGAVTAMQRGRLTSDGRTATFAPDESVTKTQVYDTLGRRVTNNDPDAGTYRYAYDPLDRLIATRDARGVVNRYWYDRGGRLVAEDLGGEVAYEPASWSTYGGTSGTPCVLGYDYVPNPSQTCFDVIYGFDAPYSPLSQAWESSLPTSVPSCASTSQGPLAGRPSWTRDRSGTVVLGYDCHGWAIWSVRQVFPDLTAGHLSLSTFDEAQRLLLETNPDGSAMSFAYSQRGMLRTAWFEEVGETAAMRLVDNATYDVQGRRISVEYPHPLCTDPYGFTCDPELVEPPDCTCDPDAYTTERLFFDARQRLSRKQAVRSDGLVLLDFRYSYDSASNIVRIDDDRDWCLDREGDPSDCPAEHAIEGYVPYDVAYDYDALYRLVRAEPIYKVPQPDRVGVQTWTFDALGSMETWTDDVGDFYGWSLGEITNGLQMAGDPGLGPLPENVSCAGGKMDILGRCVADRDGAVAPHAIYEASIGVSGGVPSDDTLRAYYDASGNMAAMVVHRPDGCDLEDTTGGPDGEGCKEGSDFALFFAWDEVGNLIKVQRRPPVIVEDPNPPSGDCFEDENPEFFEVPSGSSFYWCVAATQASLYDFGNQRRVKLEAYEDGTPTGAPEGYSVYVSANYELRQAELAYDVYAAAITSRYARDGLATSWELDSAGPGYGGGGGDPNRGRYRVTLTNHLSSVGLVLDAGTGETMRAYSQLPYGAEEKLVATPWLESRDVGRYEFTGKERDRTVGLVYFGARYLDGRLGRWVSVDPLAVHGDNFGQAFAYVGQNPLALLDPVGLQDAPADPVADPSAGGAGGVPDPDIVPDTCPDGWYGGSSVSPNGDPVTSCWTNDNPQGGLSPDPSAPARQRAHDRAEFFLTTAEWTSDRHAKSQTLLLTGDEARETCDVLGSRLGPSVSIGYGFLLYRDDGSPVGGVSLPGGAEANWYYFTFEIGNGHGHSTGGPEELLLLWAGGRALETLGALAREALAALRAARAAGGATPALRSFTASNFRTNLARLTGRIPEGAQAHHILPQEFAPQFQRLGLNIHDPRFGAWWQGGAHQQAASAYNQAWRQFLSTNPTAEQALQFAREISGSYGLTVGF